MASVKAIPRAVRYPHYPAPWCPEAFLDAVLFQKLMKKQINGCHGIHREHYDIFLAAMCGKPSQTFLDKVKHIRWYLLFEFKSLLQTTPEINDKSEVLINFCLLSKHISNFVRRCDNLPSNNLGPLVLLAYQGSIRKM